jgi:hypothetical protein
VKRERLRLWGISKLRGINFADVGGKEVPYGKNIIEEIIRVEEFQREKFRQGIFRWQVEEFAWQWKARIAEAEGRCAIRTSRRGWEVQGIG